MLIALFIHSILLFFEILLCYQVKSTAQAIRRATSFQVEIAPVYTHKWMFTFMPLFFLCPCAVAACVWGFKNDRSLEMEAILSSNVLLFIFVALKLDHVISWSWKAVFVPLWVVMCLPGNKFRILQLIKISISGIVAMYYVVWALLFFRQPQYTADRKTSLTYATLWLLVVIPMIAFEVKPYSHSDFSLDNTF